MFCCRRAFKGPDGVMGTEGLPGDPGDAILVNTVVKGEPGLDGDPGDPGTDCIATPVYPPPTDTHGDPGDRVGSTTQPKDYLKCIVKRLLNTRFLAGRPRIQRHHRPKRRNWRHCKKESPFVS